jgi:hypothetical protein
VSAKAVPEVLTAEAETPMIRQRFTTTTITSTITISFSSINSNLGMQCQTVFHVPIGVIGS